MRVFLLICIAFIIVSFNASCTEKTAPLKTVYDTVRISSELEELFFQTDYRDKVYWSLLSTDTILDTMKYIDHTFNYNVIPSITYTYFEELVVLYEHTLIDSLQSFAINANPGDISMVNSIGQNASAFNWGTFASSPIDNSPYLLNTQLISVEGQSHIFYTFSNDTTEITISPTFGIYEFQDQGKKWSYKNTL